MKIIRISLLAAVVQIAAAQQPAPASVEGIVVQAGTNAPLADVRVALNAVSGPATDDGLPAPYVTTGRDGRFLLSQVVPGSYRIVASRHGYASAEYGQSQPNGPTVSLKVAPGQRVDKVQLTMSPGAVISGRITDNGQPVGIADVYALKLTDNNGRLALIGVLSTKTNDLGDYRIFWVPPGRYHVAVIIRDEANAGAVMLSPNGDDGASVFAQRQVLRAVLNRAVGAGASENERHFPTFYPGTIDPERATLIDIRPGAEAANINIDSPVVRTWHVRGRVTGVPPNTTAKPVVGLLTNKPNAILEGLGTEATQDGTFDIGRVVSGSYTITATVGGVMGRFPVEVREQDVNNLVVNMGPGLEVKGKIVIERQTPVNPEPLVPRMQVILRPEPYIWDPLGGPATADGTFKIPATPDSPGVQPGGYRVLVAPILIPRTQPGQGASIPDAFQNAYVKSIKMGDKDLLNSTLQIEGPLQDPIEVLVGTNPGSIEGRVVTDKQQPAASVWVALVPENGLKFRTDHKFTATDVDGKFQLLNVPPGDYRIYAWENIEKFDWQEPKAMRPYESRGTAVHIDEGRKATIEFTAIPAQ